MNQTHESRKIISGKSFWFALRQFHTRRDYLEEVARNFNNNFKLNVYGPTSTLWDLQNNKGSTLLWLQHGIVVTISPSRAKTRNRAFAKASVSTKGNHTNKYEQEQTPTYSPSSRILPYNAALMAPLAASRFISLALPLPRKYIYTCCNQRHWRKIWATLINALNKVQHVATDAF